MRTLLGLYKTQLYALRSRSVGKILPTAFPSAFYDLNR